MIESIAFQTRARTIDHLGREQIADCPTAISELWKNSYDAYARNVGLHIYDGATPIAVIVDDGHGMNRDEFTNRWLVVGTESKTGASITPECDRDGLEVRVKQGQKGIGRLSSANLGALLLIVSKRKGSPFVASLIDWRLFENPYVFLMDIEVPVVEFFERSELVSILPDLLEKLLSNIGLQTSGSDRDRRLIKAWNDFNELEISEGKVVTTQKLIENTVVGTSFDERHFNEWPLWRGEKDQGTILAISDLQFDLLAQLPQVERDGDLDATARQARAQLFQTLSNLSDPFLTDEERKCGYGTEDFSTKATARDDRHLRVIIDNTPPFDLEWLYELEHVLDGKFDQEGVFKGKIKAFGNWLEDEVVIEPAIDVPSRRDSLVGEFYLRIGTYEQKLDSTSHSEESYRGFELKSEDYSGFMVYRNGLRVMPYGREGSDFFQIEKRRSFHAGREFWSLRRLFGRVALKKENNPNLRDKAGREGIIDNKAAKVFRDLVVHVLRTTARKYFGTGSDLRESVIPDRIQAYKKQKEEFAKNKLKLKNRKAFSSKLEKSEPLLACFVADVDELSDEVREAILDEEKIVVMYRSKLHESKRRLKELTISDPPRNLGSLEDRYVLYRSKARRLKEVLDLLEDQLGLALEEIKPRSARDIIYSELSANAAFLHRRIRGWVQEGRTLLSSEQDRLLLLQEERNKAYHLKMLPLLDDVESGLLTLRQATVQLEEERDIQDLENSGLFESYVSALNSLKESIDLAAVAQSSESVVEGLREEVDRLHGLAQLGITVEIIGHEIEGIEQNISSNLRAFPETVKNSLIYTSVRDSYEALVDRLRFLSPLKLSGPKTRVRITGKMILDYVKGFFKDNLESRGVSLSASSEFLCFSIVDQPARIYPVFINLINNSFYWVSKTSGIDKRIFLSVQDGAVLVSDSGPGVDADDVKYLFQLFFTRKVRGGRGVGLYLCRANLAAGGHVIEYAPQSIDVLPGANFVLKFRGAMYD
ncbi:sensor histidine kinase [Pseudomonas sp. LF242]